jgi:hypothetical protein
MPAGGDDVPGRVKAPSAPAVRAYLVLCFGGRSIAAELPLEHARPRLERHRRRATLSMTELGGSLPQQIALASGYVRGICKDFSVATLNIPRSIGPDLSCCTRQMVDELDSG